MTIKPAGSVATVGVVRFTNGLRRTAIFSLSANKVEGDGNEVLVQFGGARLLTSRLGRVKA